MDKMKEGFQRSARRMRENLNYSVGLSERRDELQSISHLEQRNQKMIAALKSTRQNVQTCIRSGNKDDSLEKRKRRVDESNLIQQLQSDSIDFANCYKAEETPVLSEIFKLIGEALDVISTERILTDQHIERNILDVWGKYIDEEKTLSKLKDKLARAAVDVEVVRKRKLGAHDETKAQEMQDEYDELQGKLDSYKDTIYMGVYTLYSKQAEIANVYKEYVNAQMEFHRTALQKFENILPEIDRKIASYPKHPVFGCHLEDHLRYSNRVIAVVLEVCCTALRRNCFNERGLFRVNGNNNRIRRMKAAFDAHEITGALPDANDQFTDPHSICSVLKLYLHSESRVPVVAGLLQSLPEANRINLAYLIRFMQLMLEYEDQIKMSVGNLSIVFGPNLMDSGTSGNESDNMLGSKIVETLLTHADTLFPNDHFDFDSPLVAKPFMAGFAGGFDENRIPPRATQVQVEAPQTYSSYPGNSLARRSAISPQTPPPRARPKCPAPPPPGSQSGASGRMDEMSSSLENLNAMARKSPSIASSDSMTEYGYSAMEPGDDMYAEASAQQGQRPVRPPPPRSNPPRVPTPPGNEIVQLNRPFSYTAAMSSQSQDVMIAPPRRMAGRRIGSTDENNRTVVHLESDSLQSSPVSPNGSGSTAPPIPKPRLPAKPKPSLDSLNEYTKL